MCKFDINVYLIYFLCGVCQRFSFLKRTGAQIALRTIPPKSRFGTARGRDEGTFSLHVSPSTFLSIYLSQSFNPLHPSPFNPLTPTHPTHPPTHHPLITHSARQVAEMEAAEQRKAEDAVRAHFSHPGALKKHMGKLYWTCCQVCICSLYVLNINLLVEKELRFLIRVFLFARIPVRRVLC